MKAITVEPIKLGEARRFVAEHHRHNDPPQGWLFGVAVHSGDRRVGVAIAGRPIARILDDGHTVEITRVCLLPGAPKNAASKAYGAICRAAAALGYTKAVTYTLAAELGTSVKASGFTRVADVHPDQSWNRRARPRIQRDLFGHERRPTGAKHRWERSL